MRKLATGFAALPVLALLLAMSWPPVAKVAEGQVRCGVNTCMGNPANPIRIQGPLIVDRPILPGSTTVIIDGGVVITGNVQINGTTTSSGLYPTAAITTLDAGQVLVQNTLQTLGAVQMLGSTLNAAASTETVATLDAGQVFVQNTLQLGSNLAITSTTIAGSCTLGGQSPSTCTATVRSGAKCVCTQVGGSAALASAGVACNVSSTTLTATSANAGSNVVDYFCW